MKSFTTCLCVVLLLSASIAYTATPTVLNYQGRLTNAGGTPVPDASYSVTFTIYDAASGGTSKWTETQSVTTSGGLFAVLLGTINPVSDSVFNSATRYLGIKVGADPEITPRTRLVSVPYSERVSTVDGSTGGAISGNIDLDFSTSNTGNIYKGGYLFLHDFGTRNTFVGLGAGNLIMTGINNVGFGYSAFDFNTTGSNNTACGMEALLANTTGLNNTAMGMDALKNNGVGSNNTASGYRALSANTSGSYNTATGTDALNGNTTGSNNTAIGFAALNSNTTGIYNTATGLGALYSNTTGSNNTALGQGSLQNNIDGTGNTAAGQYSLGSCTSGFNCAAFGNDALYNNTDGWGNTAFGTWALKNVTSGIRNTAIGYGADVLSGNLDNATAIGSGAIVDASNKVRIGSATVTVIEGQVAYTFASDRNKKENFRPVDGNEVLRKISGFKMTSWNYMNNDPSKFRHYGPMAQEFFEAFGHDGVGQIGDSVTINSGDEAGILFVAVQALEKRTAEIESLKSEVSELKSLVKSLLAEKAVTVTAK